MEKIRRMSRMKWLIQGNNWVAWLTMVGGVAIMTGTELPWFSLFAGLQPYRGIEVLNGRLLFTGGLLSLFAGALFLGRRRVWLRWGIGFLGFVLLAFAGWSLFQLLALYRQLSADPMIVAKLGHGHFVVLVGAFLIFATFFLSEDSSDAESSPSVPKSAPKSKRRRRQRSLISLNLEGWNLCRTISVYRSRSADVKRGPLN
jgi:hypothetical protein